MKKNFLLIIPILLCCSFTPRVFGNVSVTLAAMGFTYSTTNNPLNHDITWQPRGQAFLVIKNDYSFPLDMGYFELGPFTTVSVGLFPSSTYYGMSLKKGIFYNREPYHLSHDEIFSSGGLRGVTIEIPTYQFEANIYNENNQHLFECYDDLHEWNTFDSADFALEIFNKLTNANLFTDFDNLSAVGLQNQLILAGYYDNFESSSLMPNPTSFFCFNQNNSIKSYYANMEN